MNIEPHSTRNVNIYGENAPYLRSLGYCPIPAEGKSPLRKGFTKWSYNQKQATIESWAKRDSSRNIVLVTGLCKTGYDCDMVGIDCDDADAIGQGEELFGPTPGKVGTYHGKHLLYKKPKSLDLGVIHSLRPYGYNIDVKHGQRQAAILVTAPSINAKHDDFQYYWDGCDPTVIRELPWLNSNKLFDILNKGIPAAAERTEKNVESLLRDESRHLTLNDVMCGMGSYFIRGDLDGFYDEGRRQNPRIADITGKSPLTDADVVEVCNSVWCDFKRGKLTPYHGTSGCPKLPIEIFRDLCKLSPRHAGNAYAMLGELKCAHSYRVAKGETFAICPKAMARDNSFDGWTREMYENARNLLIEAGFIVQARAFSYHGARVGGKSAQYTFSASYAGGGRRRGQY